MSYKGIVATIICCLLGVGSFAQSREIDSLKKVLNTHLSNDTLKINVFNNLAFDYAYVDATRGLKYASQSIALCLKLKNTTKLATAYNYKALNYANLGKDTLAIDCYTQAISIARSNFNKSSEGKAMNNLAILYTNRAEYKKALDLRLYALAIFQELHNQKAIGSLFNNLGVTYLYLSDYPQALSSYFKALSSAQALSDTAGQARALMNIGLVYKKLGSYNNTFKYYRHALQLYRQIGDEAQMAGMLANMASAYDERGEHQKALGLYNQALTINQKNKLIREQGSNLADIGIVYSSLKQYNPAYRSFQQALELYKAAPDNNTLAVIYNELANMLRTAPDSSLLSFGINPAARYQKAEEYAVKGIAVSKESGSTEREMAGWEALSAIHEKMKLYNLALSDYRKYNVLKDSVFNDEKKLAIVRAEVQFEADKKEALAEASIQKEKIIKNSLTAGFIIVIIAAIGLWVSYKKRRDAQQAQKELVYLSKAVETDMKVLRLQMNPHFIFNSLNSISNYISKNDAKTADYFLSKFAGLMRGILEYAEEKEISLADELRMANLYMQLEAARLNNKFTYASNVAGNIDVDETLVPPLILQPFLENSVWHGIIHKEGKGHIMVNVNHKDGLLELLITDDGVGRGKMENNKRSFGIKITADRLALLNTSNNANIGVNITDLEQGTRVEIKIPYKTNTD